MSAPGKLLVLWMLTHHGVSRAEFSLTEPIPLQETSRKDKALLEGVSHRREGSHIQGQGHNKGSEVKSFLCDFL